MIRWNRVLVGCAATLLIAACGDSRSSPTGPELELRRSGGPIIGGNVTSADTTSTIQPMSSEPVATDGTDQGETRGGPMIGGN